MIKLFTPGPWATRENSFGSEVYSASGVAVARYVDVAIYESCSIIDGLGEHDARLIAMAPNLLEACEEARQMFATYAHIHASKGADEKAKRNQAMAEKLAAVIRKATEAQP